MKYQNVRLRNLHVFCLQKFATLNKKSQTLLNPMQVLSNIIEDPICNLPPQVLSGCQKEDFNSSLNLSVIFKPSLPKLVILFEIFQE